MFIVNKKGQVAVEKFGFWILCAFVFAIAFTYAVFFMGFNNLVKFETGGMEDSIIATRVLTCFSGDKLGILDEDKIKSRELKKCFNNDKYYLEINLEKENGEEIPLEPYGNVGGITRTFKRYVKLEEGYGVLRIEYRKKGERL